MISRKLMHAVINRLQVIMAGIDLAKIAEDEAKRNAQLSGVQQNIRQLTDMLNSHVKEDKRPKS